MPNIWYLRIQRIAYPKGFLLRMDSFLTIITWKDIFVTHFSRPKRENHETNIVCQFGTVLMKQTAYAAPPDLTQQAGYGCCEVAGDANHSGGVNIADATFLIARFFAGGQLLFVKMKQTLAPIIKSIKQILPSRKRAYSPRGHRRFKKRLETPTVMDKSMSQISRF